MRATFNTHYLLFMGAVVLSFYLCGGNLEKVKARALFADSLQEAQVAASFTSLPQELVDARKQAVQLLTSAKSAVDSGIDELQQHWDSL